MNEKEARLLSAPIGGAIAGAIGAGAARHSKSFPIVKGALAAGLFDGAVTAVLAKLSGANPSAEQVVRLTAGAAMMGASIGATGAAVSETSKDAPVLSGAIAGSVITFLWNAATVTVEGANLAQLQQPNNTLSGWESFP